MKKVFIFCFCFLTFYSVTVLSGEPLEVHSETGSSVDYNAKEKDVIVFIAQVYDKNQDKMSYADLIRYDFDTHKELFHAVIYRGGTSWGYKTQEFSFSRP